jgi:transposase
VANQPKEQPIHIILDNLSAHKTKLVRHFLTDHPNVHFHFTPTYSSWINQVELWFSKIERDLLHRGIFTSVTDLSKKIMRYIRKYNRDPRPVRLFRNPGGWSSLCGCETRSFTRRFLESGRRGW